MIVFALSYNYLFMLSGIVNWHVDGTWGPNLHIYFFLRVVHLQLSVKAGCVVLKIEKQYMVHNVMVKHWVVLIDQDIREFSCLELNFYNHHLWIGSLTVVALLQQDLLNPKTGLDLLGVHLIQFRLNNNWHFSFYVICSNAREQQLTRAMLDI